ncbi:hypothetical protein V496_01626 [Pseudogymnoascus sp. VKM F-4515 (FW-2607)]|nr:hypothetical protein V496_01626 [Pseudogymnoascus sp. VKM F-4515 (FW-2607)]
MHINGENVPSSVAGAMKDILLSKSTAFESRVAPNKAVIVGLYGVPGSGKTFLLGQLQQELGSEYFSFYEGSKMIATVVPGGLEAFQKLGETEKRHWRGMAINTIRDECASSGQVAIVAGHFMFWSEEKEDVLPVYTQHDLDTFTHIIYLDIPAQLVAQRRQEDVERSRPYISDTHLLKWQQAEKTQLRDLCRHHSILFSLVSAHQLLLHKVSTLLQDFRHHTEGHNLSEAERRLDEILAASQGQPGTVLVMDADRTLAAEDTGALFWKRASQSVGDENCPLKTLFSSPLGHSHTAFRQATLLYEERADDEEFDGLCGQVASDVAMHPEFLYLLREVAKHDHVIAVVITCGLSRVWDKVLEREGLSQRVKVIGGGRIADSFVVTDAVKAALVARLRHEHQLYVWAFGDSPLDLGMLSKADQAIVVVGEEHRRSKTMDAALLSAVDNGGLRARQALLPSNAPPRLDVNKLPLVQITEREFIDSVLHQIRHAGIKVYHATDRNAAKLLMTPMRNNKFAGPALKEAHHDAGRYLAVEFLSDVIGVEKYQIPHVQGHPTSGYQLFHESQTLIVALMRGGEPMASGVNKVFPLAALVHANNPSDMTRHLQDRRTVVLVDSVVNTGKTVVQFVQYIRSVHPTIHIVVVTGVAQAQSISILNKTLPSETRLSLVALRLSENKFTGSGTTDTGNRLFNTTHLP